jgi:hypothetical protein
VVGIHPLNLLRQPLAHLQSRLINRHSIHDRIGPRKVNVFKDARGWSSVINTHSRVTVTGAHVNENSFTSFNVTVVNKEVLWFISQLEKTIVTFL